MDRYFYVIKQKGAIFAHQFKTKLSSLLTINQLKQINAYIREEVFYNHMKYKKDENMLHYYISKLVRNDKNYSKEDI